MLSFEVKNIGRIAAADFHAAPLTLLVGQNNTGKSYLATLIWLLARPDLSPLLGEEMLQVKWLNELFERFAAEGSVKYNIGKDQALACIAQLQSSYDKSLKDILSRTFAYEGFENTQIKFRLSPEFEPVEISITKTAGLGLLEGRNGRKREYMEIAFSLGKKGHRRLRFPFAKGGLPPLALNRTLFECASFAIYGREWPVYRSPLYIPAARTGLMLALRPLVAQTLEFDEEATTTLPLPISNFLSSFVRAGLFESEKSPVATWLEQTVLHGTLDVTDDEIPAVSYTPEKSSTKIPLHATSSMITEMAPFIHLVAYGANGHFVFEEPEAHLHLAAQRQMARGIARLLNAGARFTITTHSDTFVQQINNLMHLHSHPDRDNLLQAMDYTLEDVINPAMAKAYEFTSGPNGTSIQELKRMEGGFAVQSLNETILALSEETIKLHEDEE